MRRVLLSTLLVLACDELPPDDVVAATDGGVTAGGAGGGSAAAGGTSQSAGGEAALVVRTLTPTSAPAGAQVELRVDGLGGIPTVTFGIASASDVQVQGSVVRCRVPAGDGLVDVTVREGTRVSSLPRAFAFEAGTDAGVPVMPVDAGTPPRDAGVVVMPMVDAGTPGQRQPTFTIEAESASAMQGVQAVNDAIGFVDDGDWLAYEGVNFGVGVDSLEVHLATPNTGGQLELRLDSDTGPLLGTLTVASTGDWNTMLGQRVSLTRTTGVRRVVLVAKARADVANIDRLVFNP